MWIQAVHREVDDPAEEAEILDPDDDGLERLADPGLEIGQELDLHELRARQPPPWRSVLVQCSARTVSSS